MKSPDSAHRLTSVYLLVVCVATVLLRVGHLPFAWNFSALGALALFSGSAVRRAWLAILIPLICRGITDSWLQFRTGYGFYNSMAFDYLAYALIALLGSRISGRRWTTVAAGSLVSAVLFFFVSNFGVWALASDHHYARDLNGLLLCLEMGLPFARGTMMGDVTFALVFFGGWNLLLAANAQRAELRANVPQSAGEPAPTAPKP